MIDRKVAKRIVTRTLSNRTDPLNERARLAREIAEKRDGDVIHFYQRSRDCDGCEADGIGEIPAHPLAVVRWFDEFNEWADGPLLEWYIVTAAEAEKIKSEPRLFIDHYAERDGY